MLDDKKLIVLNTVKADEKIKSKKKLYLLIKFYLLLYSPLYHS